MSPLRFASDRRKCCSANNKGTNAMERAGIDLQEFGANTFFDSVGISNIVDRDEI